MSHDLLPARRDEIGKPFRKSGLERILGMEGSADRLTTAVSRVQKIDKFMEVTESENP
jgi:hypothetical protein